MLFETEPRPFPVRPGGAAQLLAALEAALTGRAPLIPYAADAPVPAVPEVTSPPPDRLALCVGTSGSTGTPKLAMLTADALVASATSTHVRLGGVGQWLLAMPAQHVAGLQVLVRSLVGGTEPVVLDAFTRSTAARSTAARFTAARFTAAGFAAATRRLGGGRSYTALVPTQLVRLLADADGLAALRCYAGVLVGGAATSPALLRRTRAEGVVAVTTYGMSETAGGCVYDGVPLRCSLIRADPDGRLRLGGQTLATGYLGRPAQTAASFTTDPDGTRWFGTDDVGHRDEAGRWHVDGRIDDLITTGGLKVAPRLVEDAITEQLTQVAEAVVVGIPDDEWGQAVSAAVVLRDPAGTLTAADLRAALRGILPDHALPRRVVTLPAIPLRGPGKPDRRALAEVLGGCP